MGQLKRLVKSGWLRVEVNTSRQQDIPFDNIVGELYRWADTYSSGNFKGRYIGSQIIFAFEEENDATIFAMKWS